MAELKDIEVASYKIGDTFFTYDSLYKIAGVGIIDGRFMVFATATDYDVSIDDEFYAFSNEELPINTKNRAALGKLTKTELIDLLVSL